MKPGTKIIEQVRRNLVAIISLIVAVTSLGYNTWRNEASESNRNQRLLSIEVLRNLGQLQQVVYHRHWGMDAEDEGNPLTGWAIVLTIDDLASILEAPVPESAIALRDAWQKSSSQLGESDAAEKQIITAIDAVRSDVHTLLSELD